MGLRLGADRHGHGPGVPWLGVSRLSRAAEITASLPISQVRAAAFPRSNPPRPPDQRTCGLHATHSASASPPPNIMISGTRRNGDSAPSPLSATPHLAPPHSAWRQQEAREAQVQFAWRLSLGFWLAAGESFDFGLAGGGVPRAAMGGGEAVPGRGVGVCG